MLLSITTFDEYHFLHYTQTVECAIRATLSTKIFWWLLSRLHSTLSRSPPQLLMHSVLE